MADHYQLNLGSLRSSITLTLHTHHAARIWQGRTAREGVHSIMGMAGYISVTNLIKQAAAQDDPYADWAIMQLEEKLMQAKAGMLELTQQLDRIRQDLPGLGRGQCTLRCLWWQRRARTSHFTGFDVLHPVLTQEIADMLKCFAPLKKNLRDRTSQRLIGLLLVLGPSLAFAELPTMEAPSRGEGSGLIETIRNYAYDGGILLGLLIALLAFLGVAWHSLTVYADVQNQRKTWKDLGAVVGIGALLVVIIIWFLTKAAAIL